eukprot:3720532-Prymnesium_polylepis.1
MGFRSCDEQAGVGRLGAAVDVRGGGKWLVSFTYVKEIRLGVNIRTWYETWRSGRVGYRCEINATM